MDDEAPMDPTSRFEPTACGSYRFRFGPAGRGAPHSKKKVCLVATDLPFLVELLDQLSLRPDCYFVKFSVFARDGMHLGRCFLTADDEAGRLCDELKRHPKLFVTLQDDEVFAAYRTPASG